ncbi:MAG: DUF6503 family protein [Saonia sp.]
MNVKKILQICFLCLGPFAFSQQLSGEQLLEKTIRYHDPKGNWGTFKGKFYVTMKTPDRTNRISAILLDLPNEYFKLVARKDTVITEQTLDKGDCTLALNGNTGFSAEQAESFKLSCERAKLMKNYYTYLYGLPMKLTDTGTIIDPKVQVKHFKGKEYLVMKVTYEEAVGTDIWYFYFDPLTYAMEVYQFFHDESKNDGEYILLNGEESIQGIRMPKTRTWHYNANDTYLATDILTKTAPL